MLYQSFYRAMCWVALAAVTLTGLFSATARSAPEPSIIPLSWELGFEYETPRLIWVRLPGQNRDTPYWYMTYKIVNNTGAEQNWVPDIDIFTSTGQLIPSGQNVPPVVIRAIQNAQENPLLRNPIEVVGPLRQGEDEAMESIIVWPAGVDDVDHVQVFIGGLSGETRVLRDDDGEKIAIFRKTRMLDFEMPGTPANIVVKPVKCTGDEWIMR